MVSLFLQSKGVTQIDKNDIKASIEEIVKQIKK